MRGVRPLELGLAAAAGVLSGQYLFAEPLRRQFEEQQRAKETQATGNSTPPPAVAPSKNSKH